LKNLLGGANAPLAPPVAMGLLLKYIPDYFIASEWLEKYMSDIIGKNYKTRKAQKIQIEKQLIPIAWHPDRLLDWCMSECEKRIVEMVTY
jgi:hypothetical protein